MLFDSNFKNLDAIRCFYVCEGLSPICIRTAVFEHINNNFFQHSCKPTKIQFNFLSAAVQRFCRSREQLFQTVWFSKERFTFVWKELPWCARISFFLSFFCISGFRPFFYFGGGRDAKEVSVFARPVWPGWLGNWFYLRSKTKVQVKTVS